MIGRVDNDKGIGVAKSEIERLQFATCALEGLLCGGAPLGASIFQQALGSLSRVRRLDQVLRHAAPPSSVFRLSTPFRLAKSAVLLGGGPVTGGPAVRAAVQRSGRRSSGPSGAGRG